jgi:hypothetical protein
MWSPLQSYTDWQSTAPKVAPVNYEAKLTSQGDGGMSWVRVIPAWVWLLLAAIPGNRVVFDLMGTGMIRPLNSLRILAVALFFGLAFCRLRWWRSLRIVQSPDVTSNL